MQIFRLPFIIEGTSEKAYKFERCKLLELVIFYSCKFIIVKSSTTFIALSSIFFLQNVYSVCLFTTSLCRLLLELGKTRCFIELPWRSTEVKWSFLCFDPSPKTDVKELERGFLLQSLPTDHLMMLQLLLPNTSPLISSSYQFNSPAVGGRVLVVNNVKKCFWRKYRVSLFYQNILSVL